MKFYIDTAELQYVIKLFSVTAKINTVDVPGRVLIEAEKDGIVKFFSNNGSTAALYMADEIKVDAPGKSVVLYSKIRSFITTFKPWDGESGVKEFCFNLKGNGLYITVVNTQTDGKIIKGKIKADCFTPESIQKPKPFGDVTFILNSVILKEAINKVVYAIDAQDFNKHALQGMSIQFDEAGICFAGTNGKVLSEYKVKNVSDLKSGSFILKYDFVMGLRRILTEETQLFFEINDKRVNVKFDNVVYSGSPLVGYTYPEYKSVLDAFKESVTVSKEVLMGNILPFMDILNPDDYNRLTFSIKNKQLTFENDYGKFTSEQEIDSSIDFIIDVNGVLMKETIEHIKDDEILLKFSDESGCLIFDSGNFEDQKSLITHIRRRV
jgi:DNA polymerase III sliding clamp (beta) subunit (PCNA family)